MKLIILQSLVGKDISLQAGDEYVSKTKEEGEAMIAKGIAKAKPTAKKATPKKAKSE